MSTALLLVLAIVLLLLAYFTYGRLVSRWLGVDPSRRTPAHELRDGIDYVPARRSVLLGHHFASIAGAAPIIGPVTAIAYGWGPVFLWIVVGGIFLGAVHDLSSLVASIRHRGRSIGEVVEAHLGYAGRVLFLIFSWTALILVIAAFAIVVARTFQEVPEAATASLFFIVLALAFGGAIYGLKAPFVPSTVVGVLLLFGGIWLGHVLPLRLPVDAWLWILFAYVFAASVLPVHLLLQPRDYLNSFLLYAVLLLGVLGVCVANPEIQAPAFTSLRTEDLGWLFPMLFVTVACGAISGFHSLVSSGTTAKQLDREADAQFVGYGAMLVESLLAVLALVAVAWLPAGEYAAFMAKGTSNPVAAFSSGLGRLLGELGLPAAGAKSFVALAVSAFALTSLDTATRLARFAFQEFFAPRRRAAEEGAPAPRLPLLAQNRYLATLISVAVAASLAYSGSLGQLWPVFGSANQLLAALALLAVSVWLAHRARRNFFVVAPMLVMFAVTLSSLGLLAWQNLLGQGQNVVLGVTAVLLLGVALVLAALAFSALFGQRKALSIAAREQPSR
ncbi:MAG: carbon starvation protein A [Planctomycetes bacterium]|nr:carbon starvation protein A [Planctomycetota bacterium]